MDFQGNLKNLSKENYERLKAQILKSGFAEPFSAWRDQIGNLQLLNGHQRSRTLKTMREEGYKIPEQFPVNIIDAPDLKSAKELVLSLTSQFGEMTLEGLDEFTVDIPDFNPDDFRFPELNLEQFRHDFEPGTLEDQGKLDELVPVYMECPHCGKPFEKRQAKIIDSMGDT